jgi:hypothetical protein
VAGASDADAEALVDFITPSFEHYR